MTNLKWQMAIGSIIFSTFALVISVHESGASETHTFQSALDRIATALERIEHVLEKQEKQEKKQ